MATSGRGVVGWAARMDRFSACGMTVMDFCRAEGVSQSSYYLWRGGLCPSLHRRVLPGGILRCCRHRRCRHKPNLSTLARMVGPLRQVGAWSCVWIWVMAWY